MDKSFTSFHLFIHLGVNNIRISDPLNKNRLGKSLSLRTDSCKKKECGHFKQRTPNYVTVTVVG